MHAGIMDLDRKIDQLKHYNYVNQISNMADFQLVLMIVLPILRWKVNHYYYFDFCVYVYWPTTCEVLEVIFYFKIYTTKQTRRF